MHRHGYQGRKLGREKDQRQALMKSLAEALILEESIETTLPKAKELRQYMEKLITKAKVGDLHNRRQVISKLNTIEAAHKLVDHMAPQMTGRASGHTSIKRTALRRGDGAQMAKISFVDEIKDTPKPAKMEAKKAPAKKPAAKKAPAKKPVARKAPAKSTTKPAGAKK